MVSSNLSKALLLTGKGSRVGFSGSSADMKSTSCFLVVRMSPLVLWGLIMQIIRQAPFIEFGVPFSAMMCRLFCPSFVSLRILHTRRLGCRLQRMTATSVFMTHSTKPSPLTDGNDVDLLNRGLSGLLSDPITQTHSLALNAISGVEFHSSFQPRMYSPPDKSLPTIDPMDANIEDFLTEYLDGGERYSLEDFPTDMQLFHSSVPTEHAFTPASQIFPSASQNFDPFLQAPPPFAQFTQQQQSFLPTGPQISQQPSSSSNPFFQQPPTHAQSFSTPQSSNPFRPGSQISQSSSMQIQHPYGTSLPDNIASPPYSDSHPSPSGTADAFSPPTTNPPPPPSTNPGLATISGPALPPTKMVAYSVYAPGSTGSASVRIMAEVEGNSTTTLTLERDQYVYTAAQQAHQLWVTLTVESDPPGQTIAQDVTFEICLHNEENNKVHITHLGRERKAFPPLSRWAHHPPKTMELVHITLKKAEISTKLSIRIHALSNQEKGPFRLILVPTDPRFRDLHVELPKIHCISRKASDAHTAMSAAMPSGAASSTMTAPVAQSSSAALASSGRTNGNKKRRVKAEPTREEPQLSFFPPLGPAQHVHPVIHIRLDGISPVLAQTQPLQVSLVRRGGTGPSSINRYTAIQCSHIVTEGANSIKAGFRLPHSLPVGKYGVESTFAGSSTSASKTFTACALRITTEPHYQRPIEGLAVAFSFSFSPHGVHTGGFRLYTSEGHVIETNMEHTITFATYGTKFAVAELIDETFGSGRGLDDGEAISSRIVKVSKPSRDGRRAVWLEDRRQYFTSVPMDGFPAVPIVDFPLDETRFGPSYGIYSPGIQFTLIQPAALPEQLQSNGIPVGGPQGGNASNPVSNTQNALGVLLQNNRQILHTVRGGTGGGLSAAEITAACDQLRSSLKDALKTAVKFHLKQEVAHMKDALGNTYLHIAAALGEWEAATCLLMWGANPSEVNLANDTPVHEAARHKQTRVLDVLFSWRADFSLKGSLNKTAVELFPDYFARVGKPSVYTNLYDYVCWDETTLSEDEEGEGEEEEDEDECTSSAEEEFNSSEEEEVEEEEECDAVCHREKNPFATHLQDDLVAHIFSFLHTFDLSDMKRVCRQFRSAAHIAEARAPINNRLHSNLLSAIATRFTTAVSDVIKPINTSVAYGILEHTLRSSPITQDTWQALCEELVTSQTKNSRDQRSRYVRVFSQTMPLLRSCERVWRQWSDPTEQTITWAHASTAVSSYLSPQAVSVQDMDNIRTLVAIASDPPAPVLDRDAFVRLWAWVYYARLTYWKTRELWVGSANTQRLLGPVITREQAVNTLKADPTVGTYVVRLCSKLWPDPDAGCLAVSIYTANPQFRDGMEHDLLDHRDVQISTESIVRTLQSSPERYRKPILVPVASVDLIPPPASLLLQDKCISLPMPTSDFSTTTTLTSRDRSSSTPGTASDLAALSLEDRTSSTTALVLERLKDSSGKYFRLDASSGSTSSDSSSAALLGRSLGSSSSMPGLASANQSFGNSQSFGN
mmetsp:Transcript_12029/g.20445  ORF Transcript_12029/g.20445 Transcript_12029/m.20445 type:complete len:1516 (-) Transcript_12029:958-5505(-)